MKHLHTFESFLNESSSVEYTIKNIENNDYIVRAQISGKTVGELRFIKSRNKPVLMAGSLSVDPSHRRKGIASSMYEFAEAELDMKFVKSEDVLTPDGKLLWNNPNRKFGLVEASNNDLIQVTPKKIIHHTSNPFVRSIIAKQGLITQAESAAWLSDTNISGKVIFAVNSSNIKDAWDSTYDDDIYQIDTADLKNKWYSDPNFDVEDDRIITFENIPVKKIKLVYKGTGK